MQIRRSSFHILIALLLYPAIHCTTVQAYTTRTPSDCNQYTATDWDQYIEGELLTRIQNGRSISVGTHESPVLNKISQLRQTCAKQFTNPNILKCFERIESYYRQFEIQRGTFSGRMTDAEYEKSIPTAEKDLPPELAKLPRGIPKNWKEVFSKNGMSYAHFHSHVGDSARLVVRIPGKKFDRLLVYYSYDSSNSDPSTYQGIQMQIVEKPSAGKSGKEPQLFFRDFELDDVSKLPRARSESGGGRCIACHASGPRAVVPQKPARFPTSVGGVKSLDEFNQQILLSRAPDLSPYFETKHFPKHLQVGKDCIQCHDGKERSSLAAFVTEQGTFLSGIMRHKVVTEQSMPREYYSSLDHRDRVNFVRELQVDYQTELRKWLSETKCDPKKNTATGLQRGLEKDESKNQNFRK